MAKTIDVRGILLDMDGTLVQSGNDVENVWGAWCRIHNIPLEDVMRICHGVRSLDVVARIAPQLDGAEEHKRLEELEIKLSSTGTCIPDADKFLKALCDAPVQSWAVVTSASRAVALHRMKLCHLPVPALLISSENVVKGKPDAEPYRVAAQKLNIAPDQCIVFEDALAGIESGLSAGCQVVQIGGHKALHKGVFAVIADWRQVKVEASGHGYRITIADRPEAS